MEKRYTRCHLCSGGRPIAVHLEEGKLVATENTPYSSLFFKYFCPKLQAASEIVYSPERLKSPLIKEVRKGKTCFREASWPEALDRIAEKFESVRAAHGAEAVCWVSGHVPDYGAPWDYANRLMSAFGSPNIIGNGSICHAARELAHVCTYGAMTSPDYSHSKCILIWGKNDRNCNRAGYTQILAAQKEGARLIVVDPVKTRLASRADLWLQIKPGGDGLLAMAMMQTMFEEGLYDSEFAAQWTIGLKELKETVRVFTPEDVAPRIWLTPGEIREAAALYAGIKPACLSDGNGLDMHLDMSQTMRAICILRALSGNLDRKGGDLLLKSLPVRDIKLKDRLPKDCEPITAGYPLFRGYHPARGDHILGAVTDALLEDRPYPIKALVLQGTNPVVTLAHSSRVLQAMKRVGFMVVIDLFMTRTARLAEMVLPASSPFETTQFNLRNMSAHAVTLQDQVIPSYEDSWPDWRIIFELGRRLGLEEEFPWDTVEEAIDYQLEPTGTTVEMLRAHPSGLVYEEMQYDKFRVEGFRTASGKVEFYSESYEEYGYPPIPRFDDGMENHLSFYDRRKDFPILGISGARSGNYIHSQYRNIPSLLKREPWPYVDIHPMDAETTGVQENEWVRVESPNGWIRMKARVSECVHPGSVRIAWGWGEFDADYNINNLTDDSEHDPVTSTTSNRCFMCRIVREERKWSGSFSDSRH